MSVDLYQPCPGGLDKKIKFCCKDLAHELDRITRLVKADQDKAALEYVERLVEQYPDRQCLLAWNARLRIALSTPDEARPAVTSFLQHAPNNPLALCSMAVVEARTIDAELNSAELANGELANSELANASSHSEPASTTTGRLTNLPELSASGRRAVDAIQRTMECVTKLVPGHLASALVMIGRRLFMEGFPIAAREHLSFALTLQGNSTKALGRNDLIESYQTRDYPLLLKDSTVMPRVPGHVAWRAEYVAATQDASRGRWRQALRRLKELDGRYPNQAAIILAIANLHLRLAENGDAVKRLRSFAKLEGVSETDAVYTEALAFTLEPPVESQSVDLVRLSFTITDANRLAEQLLGSKRAIATADNLSEMADEGEPPPQIAFVVLDREMPLTAHGLEPDAVPMVLGEVFLFGKQTDRDARLEVDTHRDWRLDALLTYLGDFAELIQLESRSEEVLDTMPLSFAVLALDWRVPSDANADQIESISTHKQRQIVLQQWPDLQQAFLDGRTARDAALDPNYRTRVLALILAIEGGYMRYLTLDDFDELYRTLQLAIPQPKSIFIDDLANSPAVRLARVDPAPLSDSALESAFHHAVTVMAPHAIRRFGMEIIRRGKLNNAPVNEERVFTQLAAHAETTTVAVEMLGKAADVARKAGRSPATHLLSEIELRIRRGESAETQRLVERIMHSHGKEPGVTDALRRVLANHGIGRRRRSAEMLASATSDPPAVWTPDSSEGPQDSSGSKLWVPEG